MFGGSLSPRHSNRTDSIQGESKDRAKDGRWEEGACEGDREPWARWEEHQAWGGVVRRREACRGVSKGAGGRDGGRREEPI